MLSAMGDRRSCAVAVIAVLAAGLGARAPVAGAIPPPFGGLTETQCVSEDAGNGCVAGDGIGQARMVAISSDAKNVYVASGTGGGGTGGAVAAFARNPTTGALTELNCVAATAGRGCATAASGLSAAWGVAVSPDGATIYVTSPTFGGGSVAAFARNPATGAIGSELDCVAETATGTCVGGRGLTNAKGVAVSNAAVYVSAADLVHGGLASFARGAVTGALGSETACFNSLGNDMCTTDPFAADPVAVAVAADGRAVYAVSASGATTSYVTSYLVDQAGRLSTRIGCVVSSPTPVAGCVAGSEGFDGPGDVAVAPDHRVYVAAPGGDNISGDSGGLAGFSVDANTFGLTGMINCVATDAPGCPAPFQRNLELAEGVAVSPDGQQIYAAAQGTDEPTSGTVSAYTRNAGNGAIGSLINCIGEDSGDGCIAGDGIANASFVAVSPEGRNVYVGDGSGGGSNSGGVTTFAREMAPVCTSTTATVQAGADVAVGLTCSDPNGDPITRTVTIAPGSGVLSAIDQVNGSVTYTASALATGGDTFTFTASDGALTSAPATATITVTQIGSTPHRNTAPDTNITGLHRRVKARSLTKFTGTASDDVRVAKVEIALVHATAGAHAARRSTKHKPHPGCRQLSSRGTFLSSTAKKGKCAPTVWLKATGTAKWSYRLRKRLPAGSYTLYARATDNAGLREPSFSAADHNRVRFTVKP